MLSQEQSEVLLRILEERFEKNAKRHVGIDWVEVKTKLTSRAEKIWSLNEMEKTGGEPDVIGYDKETKEYLFCDCSEESPIKRRSTCYDQEALNARKENKPKDSAVHMAKAMGIQVLTQDEYQKLQELGNFDTKTSSWLVTPKEIRELGGAIFADRRYNHVFIYHNGADSYYAARGFRGLLRV